MPKNTEGKKEKRKKGEADALAAQRTERQAERVPKPAKSNKQMKIAKGRAFTGHISNQSNANLRSIVEKQMPGWETALGEIERRQGQKAASGSK